MRLTSRMRHRLVRLVRREAWDAATKAQVIACIERVHADGGTLDLDIEFNGDAPFFDPNAVVVQALDYFGLVPSLAS